MKHNQHGFGIVGIISIIVLVGLIGFGGWYVWQANQKPAAKSTSTASTTDNSGGGDTKYLTITEWGVKIPLTAETADAYYDTYKANGSASVYSLRSHSLDGAPDCKNSEQSVAAVHRDDKGATADNFGSGQPVVLKDAWHGVDIGDHVYYITGAQYACTDDPALSDILSAVHIGFVGASSKIQAK